PYHFDAAGVVLFHLRGRKRVFVYPGDEAHLPERSMELVVARQTTEEIPYTPVFEAEATVIDLEPGQALTWPLYAPHRVRNLDAFCVSLSMDFQTWDSRLRNGALYTNAVLRSQGRAPRSTDRMRRPELAARWAASLALKRVGILPDRLRALERDFTPARDGVNGVRALDAGA
ncbi:MAG: transcriptional regulator, partial [Brevundimonas sp.]